MGLFKSLFKKDIKPKKRGFLYAEIIDLVRETKDTVKVVLSLDAKDKFVRDFVNVWDKIMNLDRFDLA